MSKPPISIRVIGFAFTFFGALSAADIIAALVLGRSPKIDLGVFLALIGVALLRRSDAARRCAAFLCGLAAIGLGVSLVAVLLLGLHSASLSDWLPKAAICAIALALVSLAWRKLTSKAAVECFQSRERRRESRSPFQYGVSSLLFCTFIVAVVFARLGQHEPAFHPRRIISDSGCSSNGIYVITYGIRENRRDPDLSVVDFVVIETRTGSRELRSAVSTDASSEPFGTDATLTTPDGREIGLPNDKQLYEIKDGVFRALRGGVSKRQLEAYLHASPTDPNIDDLIATRADELTH